MTGTEIRTVDVVLDKAGRLQVTAGASSAFLWRQSCFEGSLVSTGHAVLRSGQGTTRRA